MIIISLSGKPRYKSDNISCAYLGPFLSSQMRKPVCPKTRRGSYGQEALSKAVSALREGKSLHEL